MTPTKGTSKTWSDVWVKSDEAHQSTRWGGCEWWWRRWRFAAVRPADRRYRSAAGRRSRTAFSSKCEQCHVISWRRKLNTGLRHTQICNLRHRCRRYKWILRPLMPNLLTMGPKKFGLVKFASASNFNSAGFIRWIPIIYGPLCNTQANRIRNKSIDWFIYECQCKTCTNAAGYNLQQCGNFPTKIYT